MSEELLGRFTTLPPVEIGGLVVDIALLFRPSLSAPLPRRIPLNLAVACAFGAALSQHQEALGLSRDQVFRVSIAFAEVCDVLFGAPELAERQIGGAR
jgi:hypothetical protein